MKTGWFSEACASRGRRDAAQLDWCGLQGLWHGKSAAVILYQHVITEVVERVSGRSLRCLPTLDGKLGLFGTQLPRKLARACRGLEIRYLTSVRHVSWQYRLVIFGGYFQIGLQKTAEIKGFFRKTLRSTIAASYATTISSFSRFRTIATSRWMATAVHT